MDIKIRHKLIEIEDRVSDRFVILVKNIGSSEFWKLSSINEVTDLS